MNGDVEYLLALIVPRREAGHWCFPDRFPKLSREETNAKMLLVQG